VAFADVNEGTEQIKFRRHGAQRGAHATKRGARSDRQEHPIVASAVVIQLAVAGATTRQRDAQVPGNILVAMMIYGIDQVIPRERSGVKLTRTNFR
jgi:hypothetical protein